MPIIYIEEDQTAQYSSEQSKYYFLTPQYLDIPDSSTVSTHQSIEIERNEPVKLRSRGVHHCHTIIIKDLTKKNYFLLHVSPTSLQRPYNSISKKAEDIQSWGIEAQLINLKKPAYIELDSYYYGDDGLGIDENSKLEVILVVNHEYSEEAKEVLTLFQNRVPGERIKSNVIITEALKHAYFYEVEFDVQTASVTIASQTGLYEEHYSNPFENNKHGQFNDQLPEKPRKELITKAEDSVNKINYIAEIFINRDDFLETPSDNLILNLPQQPISQIETISLEEVNGHVNLINSILEQSKFPLRDLGSLLFYKMYSLLGFLYSFMKNYELSAFYFSTVADYVGGLQNPRWFLTSLWYSPIYCILAGASYERCGKLELAYKYYQSGFKTFSHQLTDREIITAQLRLVRVASKIKGKEKEALEHALSAKDNLIKLKATLLKSNSKVEAPQSEVTALNRTLNECQQTIDNLQNQLTQYTSQNSNCFDQTKQKNSFFKNPSLNSSLKIENPNTSFTSDLTPAALCALSTLKEKGLTSNDFNNCLWFDYIHIAPLRALLGTHTPPIQAIETIKKIKNNAELCYAIANGLTLNEAEALINDPVKLDALISLKPAGLTLNHIQDKVWFDSFFHRQALNFLLLNNKSIDEAMNEIDGMNMKQVQRISFGETRHEILHSIPSDINNLIASI